MTRSSTTPARPIIAAMRTVPIPTRAFSSSSASAIATFITISRQRGTGAVGVGSSFVDAINAQSPGAQKWTFWDHELVGKVAADHHLSARLIEGLEDKDHSWMSNFLSTISFTDASGSGDEDRVYHKVKRTIEALATAGRVVIIGRGGMFITRNMPGAIAIRLVAPFKDRVAFIAHKFNVTERAAASQIREWEHNRRQFFKMQWPGKPVNPEIFALTINTAQVRTDAIVQMMLDLVQQKQAELAEKQT